MLTSQEDALSEFAHDHCRVFLSLQPSLHSASSSSFVRAVTLLLHEA
jgi:hypothetical protein